MDCLKWESPFPAVTLLGSGLQVAREASPNEVKDEHQKAFIFMSWGSLMTLIQ